MQKKMHDPTTSIRNFARFVSISRSNYSKRLVENSEFRTALRKADVVSNNDKNQYPTLTRSQVVTIASKLMTEDGEIVTFTQTDLANFEHGKTSLTLSKQYSILRGLGFDSSEANRILDLFLMRSGKPDQQINPSLYLKTDRELLIGLYGDHVAEKSFRVGEKFICPWVTVASADSGGFVKSVNGDEIAFKVDEKSQFEIPKAIKAVAESNKKKWAADRAANLRAPHNGPTLALTDYFVDSTEEEGSGERNVIRLNLAKSEYALNVAAKNSPDAEILKYDILSKISITDEFQPVPWLASGVGIAVNIFCEGGDKVVVGHRSNLETFRSSEYDVAVVEGIQGGFNRKPDHPEYVDIHEELWRGLDEELGLGGDRSNADDIEIFAFGCDLKYYQWNFLATVTFDLSLDEIKARWDLAKHRRENHFLSAIDANTAAVLSFIEDTPIWSCGVACMLESIRRKELREQRKARLAELKPLQ